MSSKSIQDFLAALVQSRLCYRVAPVCRLYGMYCS